MVAVLPFAIVLGAAGAAALLFYGLWERLLSLLGPFAHHYALELERAKIKRSQEEVVLANVTVAAIVWALYMIAAHPPLAIGFAMLPLSIGVTFVLFGRWIGFRIARRLAAFNDQLETIMRLLASAIRAGLSMRQAFVVVSDEMDEPARGEFRQVIAQTDVGLPANDALTALAERMPSDELGLMVRAVIVNAQTGGNLGKILDHLALTIRERRRIKRKIKALTAEGTASAWIIGALPLGVGAFIVTTQPHMRAALLGTTAGHASLVTFVLLEAVGILSVVRLVRVDV